MTHITIPSGEWLLVELLQNVSDIQLHKVQGISDSYLLTYFIDDLGTERLYLPPGSYQLHGIDPLNLTEEEAAQVVESMMFEDGRVFYWHYVENLWVENKTESYYSLLAANGHKVGECVTLKKVK